MLELSVTQYAKQLDLTRQAVLAQIKENRLPDNVVCRKVGSVWILSVPKK